MGEGKLMDGFTGLYSVSKTLRFELKPVGRTLEYIQRDGIIEADSHREESYKKLKEIIDRYHKDFIAEVLADVRLEGLQDYYDLYCKSVRDEKQEKQFEGIKISLRKQISSSFKAHPKYKTLFKKELVKKDLISYTAEDSEDKHIVEEFSDYSTYLTGFHKNRENMYSAEEKATAIAFRLIDQNLPKFVDNIRVYKRLHESEILPSVYKAFHDICSKDDVDKPEVLFELEGFQYVLTQKGIDNYNDILGGIAKDDGTRIQGLNEYINLYNQSIKGNAGKLPLLKPLYKQILSDRESSSFVLDKFSSDQEVLDAVQNFYLRFEKNVLHNEKGSSVERLIEKLDSFDLNEIYIANDASITSISQYLFDDWSVIRNAISFCYDQEHLIIKEKKAAEKYEDLKSKELKKIKAYSIHKLNQMAESYTGKVCTVESYFIDQISEKIVVIQNAYADAKELLQSGDDSNNALNKNQEAIDKIKGLLDAVKELQQLLKPLMKGQNETTKDEMFYGEFAEICDEINLIDRLYNKVRNYVTKKPYSLEKIKLNFDKSTLLDGWDRNKEKDNLGILFIKDGFYYLGIMNRKCNRVMDDAPEAYTKDIYQKIEYKLLPGPNKMLPKVFFSKSRIEEFSPSDEILENYKKGTHTKGEDFSLSDCHKLIDFFKESIRKHEEWSQFDFHFSDTETYEDISGFYREVEQQGYKITFKDIDREYINELVENGQLYLFQIYNKDFSPYSKGTPNLHTLYWKMLFSPENLEKVVYKLNGQAEIFYRKKSIEDGEIITHEANVPIANRYPYAEKKTSVFSYELTKDRRFTVDKFQFHVPITINFQSEGETRINQRVRAAIHEEKDMHIIGIDRGERNLLYLVVIDLQGNIKEQISLNQIDKKDYHKILDDREKDNKVARQDWKAINTIKELKEGYLSQVIHQIAQLMVKYNAILVLEDLNMGFMRSRQKFEKQVYQKFEKMLIDKLNYLVDKHISPEEKGGLLNGYQLTDRFDSFQKLGKQSGFLFYVPAWNTSKIDPTTGFVNLFYTKYESKEKTRAFINKFDKIMYNEIENYFEFSFDYSNFTYKADGGKTKWRICSVGKRIESFRNPLKNSQWDRRTIDLTQEMINLLTQYQIALNQENLINSIIAVEDTDFYRSFMHLVSLLLQMRNSDSQTGEDWMISPVKNQDGYFFRTLGYLYEINDGFDFRKINENYIKDADANGAYNIAKKGLWIVEKLQQTDADQLNKANLAISNKEWLSYAQEHTL
jgi:CRISPR-associated protein Cpf1